MSSFNNSLSPTLLSTGASSRRSKSTPPPSPEPIIEEEKFPRPTSAPILIKQADQFTASASASKAVKSIADMKTSIEMAKQVILSKENDIKRRETEIEIAKVVIAEDKEVIERQQASIRSNEKAIEKAVKKALQAYSEVDASDSRSLGIQRAELRAMLEAKVLSDSQQEQVLKSAIDNDDAYMLDALQKAGFNLKASITLDAQTPLMYAISKSRPQAIEKLLECDVDVNEKNMAGLSPIQLAISATSSGQDADNESLQLLLEKQPNLQVLNSEKIRELRRLASVDDRIKSLLQAQLQRATEQNDREMMSWLNTNLGKILEVKAQTTKPSEDARAFFPIGLIASRRSSRSSAPASEQRTTLYKPKPINTSSQAGSDTMPGTPRPKQVSWMLTSAVSKDGASLTNKPKDKNDEI